MWGEIMQMLENGREIGRDRDSSAGRESKVRGSEGPARETIRIKGREGSTTTAARSTSGYIFSKAKMSIRLRINAPS